MRCLSSREEGQGSATGERRVGTNKGATVPTLYRPVLQMLKGLCLMAVTLGLVAGAIGDATQAGDLLWVGIFMTLLGTGLIIFGWLAYAFATFVSDDPVDREVDDDVDWWHEPWCPDDHHSGDCRYP